MSPLWAGKPHGYNHVPNVWCESDWFDPASRKEASTQHWAAAGFPRESLSSCSKQPRQRLT
jgi:hypothetical protein